MCVAGGISNFTSQLTTYQAGQEQSRCIILTDPLIHGSHEYCASHSGCLLINYFDITLMN
jgi:hypothetical protein